jgi:hypothetical protein
MSIIFTTLHRHPVRNDHYNVEKLIHQLTQLPQPITIEMVATKMSQFSFQHYSVPPNRFTIRQSSLELLKQMVLHQVMTHYHHYVTG